MLILLLLLGGGILGAEAYAHHLRQREALARQLAQHLLTTPAAPTLTLPSTPVTPAAPTLTAPTLTAAVGDDPQQLARDLAAKVRQLRQVEQANDPLARAALQLDEARAMQEAYQAKLNTTRQILDQVGPGPATVTPARAARLARLVAEADAAAPVADDIPVPVVIDAAPPSSQSLDD
jgi:hypothetical protein